MSTPLFYRSTFLYDLLMRVLYRRYWNERGEALAQYIDPKSSVLDICCGTGELYRKHLRQKGVIYEGVDLNSVFIQNLQAQGVTAVCADALSYPIEPRSYDYVVLQGSLSEFPVSERRALLGRLHRGARKGLLLSESVRHLIYNSNPFIKWFASRIGRPLRGAHKQIAERYRPDALEDFMQPLKTYLQDKKLICGGRTMLYALRAKTDLDEKAP